MRIPLKTARRFLHGDEQAIAEVYLASRHLLYFVIRSLVTDKDDADDVYEDVFARVLAARSSIKDPRHLRDYLVKAAQNAALDAVRKKARPLDYTDLMDAYGEEDHGNAYLQEFAPYLSDLEVAVLVYRLEYGFSYREIASLTGVSRQTANDAYHRTLRILKKKLGGKDHVHEERGPSPH